MAVDVTCRGSGYELCDRTTRTVTDSCPICRIACSAPCTRHPITVEGNWARPTPRKSASVATSMVRSSAIAASTRADSASSTCGTSEEARKLPSSGIATSCSADNSLATSVGEQAVDNPGHVPDVKCSRCDTGRTTVPLLFRQVTNQLTRALSHLQKDVRNWLKNGRHAIDRAALPPLCARHRYRLSIRAPEITTSTSASVGPNDHGSSALGP